MTRHMVGIAIAAAFVFAAFSAAWCSESLSIHDAEGKVVIEDAGKGDIERLVELLGDERPEVSSQAGSILVEFGDASVPALINALGKRPAFPQVAATLASIKDERAIAPLAKFINDPSAEISDPAKGALRQFGQKAMPALAELMKEPAYAEAAFDILKDQEPSGEVLETVRATLDEKAPAPRAYAVLLLGYWKDDGSAEKVKGLVADQDEMVRSKAAEGYTRMFEESPDKYDFEFLKGLLDDPSALVRLAAAKAMENMGDTRIVEPLIGVVEKEEDLRVLNTAVVALEKPKDGRAVFPLIKRLERQKGGDEFTVFNIIYTLGILKAPEAVPYITDIMKEGFIKDEGYQWTFLYSLNEIGVPVDTALLVPYIRPGLWPEAEGFLLDILYRDAKPGDKQVISALEDLKAGEKRPELREKIDSVLDRLR